MDHLCLLWQLYESASIGFADHRPFIQCFESDLGAVSQAIDTDNQTITLRKEFRES